MNRRRFLAVTGAIATPLAGCVGGSGPADGTAGSTPTDDAASTERAGQGNDGLSGDHAALSGIESQPFLGPPPGEAPGLIVAFEDPSCPTCRRFERDVVPTIRERLTDTGKATFVFRGYPVIYPWGEPATHALEATYAADEAAFWSLAAHYFEEQSAFRAAGVDAVYDHTESFLAEETAIDARSVVGAAERGEFDDAVRTDLDAGESAGAGGTTPSIFLFRDGDYRTKAVGSVSYSVIAGALGL